MKHATQYNLRFALGLISAWVFASLLTQFAVAETPTAAPIASADAPISFVTEVQPLLTKLGCNQGACHGAQYGQGGFKLSLRAFDDLPDYDEITKRAHGRRIRLSAPASSLLLQKPLMDVPHKGGRRLSADSHAYRVLLRWLEQGAPGPTGKDRVLKQIVVTPVETILEPGRQFQVEARAIYEDGFEEPVVAKASLDSVNPSVAEITADGLVTAVGRGEGVVMVRYMGKVGVSRLIVPYGVASGLEAFPRKNYIDELWVEKWRKTGLAPAESCSDDEFFRRIHVTTLGALPRSEDVRNFVADTGPDKRDKAIEAVLSRPEYADCWSNKWGDLLRNSRSQLQKKGMWSLHNWLRASFRDNKPMSTFAEELITAVGSPYANGPVNFYGFGYADEWTEASAQVLLGVRLQCAKCHHHPFENISQGDFFSMKAFFARIGKKTSIEFGLQGGDSVIYVQDTGEVGHPKTGQILKPKPPGGEEIDDAIDRRRALARWLVEPSNPAYARNLANRYWGYYMGRGLVHPIDDLRMTNPASNPELLDALAKDLIAHNYDIKHLLRTIMQSQVYQRSSVRNAASDIDGDNRYCTHYEPTRFSAEQLLDGIDSACGTQEKFAGLPLGFKAISLPDTDFPSDFLDAFGRPKRRSNCECDRSGAPNMTQALMLMGGNLLNVKTQDGNGRVAKLIAAKTPVDQAVEEIFLATVGRLPNAEERADAIAAVEAAPSLKEGLEDFLWAMLNTREFQFNH